MNYTADIWASARGLLDFLAMSEPKIAGREPKAVELTAGKKYFWCACGQSKNQPSCDRSHVGTEFTPVSFTPDATGTAYFCMCKRTGNRPYCDGTHATLDAEFFFSRRPPPPSPHPSPRPSAGKSLFACVQCGSTDVQTRQMQTRSADEPMTVFCACLKCGKRWKK